MHAQNQRILLSFLPADWLDEKAIDIPIVSTLVSEALHVREFKLRPQRFVKMTKSYFVASVEIGKIQVIEMFEIIGQVNHLLIGPIKINAAHRARARSNRGRGLVRQGDTKQLVLAFHACPEL